MFKIKSQFKPSGDQPQAIETLIKSIEKKRKFQTLLGVTGSGKTFTMSCIVERLQRPTLVICHNKTLAAQLAAEFQEFFPDNAIHYFVSYYDYYQPESYIPRSDTYIEKETQINDEIDRLRNSATQSLLSRKDVLIVASVSCIYGLGNPSEYNDLAFTLEVGKNYKRDKIIRRLSDLQYKRNDMSIERGTFRFQGDTLEVILSSEDTKLAFSFFGDELERVKRLDALTGDELEKINSVKIFPAKHFVASSDRIKEAIGKIRDELVVRLKNLREEGRLLEAARLEQRTNFDIEFLTNTGFVQGIENYSRHLDGREEGESPSVLLDYFPDDFLMFIDESHQTIPQIGAMYHGDRSRKSTLVEYGFRLPSALDNRPLKFEEFENKINQAIFVSATPSKFEIEKSIELNVDTKGKKIKIKNPKEVIAEQVIRPTGLLDPTIEIVKSKGQIDDLIIRLKERIKKKERCIVTTLTKKMAEELTDYIREVGIKVQYLHSEVDTMDRLEILRDLRIGTYDVIIGINLLREGLDLPEVSLVAILDADKEGFLRSRTSFLQIIGRAARHINGNVVMYADRITDSMKHAIDETSRRRKIQEEYNTKHGITPTTITKKIQETRLSGMKQVDHQVQAIEKDVNRMDAKNQKLYIKELNEAMDMAAHNLDFELAAKLRDKIAEIREIVRLNKL